MIHSKPQEPTFKGKNFLQGSKFIPLKVNPNFKGSENKNSRVAPPEHIPSERVCCNTVFIPHYTYKSFNDFHPLNMKPYTK